MSGAIPLRPLGKTGVSVSALGLGGHHIGDPPNVDDAIDLMHRAIDAGLTYFDNCWEYHNGESEVRMGRALQGRRDKVFLATKVCTHGRDGALGLEMLEQSLRRLGTDRVDLWQIHGVTFENDPELAFRQGGVIEALAKAKQQGKTRFVGFTGHKDPGIHLKMLAFKFPFDTCQFPLNCFDATFRSFEAKVLPECVRQGIAPLGMKPMSGRAEPIKKGLLGAEEMLRYAMSLPVATTITGIESVKILEQNLAVARGFKPMTGDEMKALRERARATAKDGRFEIYKTSIAYDNPEARRAHSYPIDAKQKEIKEEIEDATKQGARGSGGFAPTRPGLACRSLASLSSRARRGLVRRHARVRLGLKLRDHLAEDLDEVVPASALPGAPLAIIGPLVGQHVLHAVESGAVGVGVELGHDLIGEDEPVVRGPDRRARALRRVPGPVLLHLEVDLPLLRCDLLFGPDARVVVPFVAASDFHTLVAASLERLESVIALRGHDGFLWPEKPTARASTPIASPKRADSRSRPRPCSRRTRPHRTFGDRRVSSGRSGTQRRLMSTADPRTRHPKPPFDEKPQESPGQETALKNKPDHGEDSYRGSAKLTGRVALITGGDSGIGRAVALAYAREGADCAIAFLSEQKDAEETERLVKSAGRRALLLPGDLASREHCAAIVERTARAFGRLDIVVNNAAYQGKAVERFDDIPPDRIEKTFLVNIVSMFHVVQAALAHLRAGGTIINTASIQAYDPTASILDYAATKAAIVAFTKGLGETLVERGIRVNAVAPGPVWTPLIAQSFTGDKLENFGKSSPMKRPAQPAELAPAYVFLASDDSSYVSGEILGVTGGRPLA